MTALKDYRTLNRHDLKSIREYFRRLGRYDTFNIMVEMYGFSDSEAVRYLNSLS